MDAIRQQLSHAGSVVRLEPRVLEVLIHLARHAGRVVSKDELLDQVWRTPHVTDWAISRAIAELRKVLRQHEPGCDWIRTVYGRGFRMLEPVEVITATTPLPGARVNARRQRVTRGAWSWGLLLVSLAAGALYWWPESTGDAASLEPVSGMSEPHILVAPRWDPGTLPAWQQQGLLDAVISGLAHAPSVRVYTRQTAQRLVDHNISPLPEAQRLGASHLLALQLQEGASGLILDVTLLRSRDARVLSRQTHAVGSEPVSSLGPLIVEATLAQLDGRTTNYRQAHAAPTPAAEVALLRGRHFLARRGAGDLDRSLQFFDQAIAIDPNYAPAWSGKASAHLLQRVYYLQPAAAALPLARSSAERALELDPDLADGHAAMGLLALNVDTDFDLARARYDQAIALAPSHVQALQWSAELAMLSGDYKLALARIRQASALDPVSPLLTGIWGTILATAGDRTGARDKFNEALQLDPRFVWIHRELAHLAEFDGDVRGALQSRRREMALRGFSATELARLDAMAASQGLTGFRLWYLAQLGGVEAAGSSPVPELLAESLAALGRHEEAEAILRKLGHDGGESLLHLLTRSPAFRDPRYRNLAMQLGFDQLLIPSH
ncbi:MAG: winged helix-turn-helix domain-containing protein [Lysobacterales bacterium]